MKLRNTKNKLLSVLLSAAMLLTFAVVPISAEAVVVGSDTEWTVSDYYSSENRSLWIQSSGSSISVDSNAVNKLRTSFGKHESQVEVKVKFPKNKDDDYKKDYGKALFEKAVEHTGIPTQGDFIEYQMIGWYFEYSGSVENGQNYMNYKFVITYLTTAAQDKELDEKVSEIITSLNLGGKSDYQKVKAIYDYVCDNVVYDNVALMVAVYTPIYYPAGHSAYGALCKGTSVCQGYAAAMYRLLLTAGIDARIMSGTSHGESHAWNIVRLGDKYYLIDSTWDAGVDNYEYFLKSWKDFPDHDPEDKFKTASFKAEYPIASSSYDPSNDTEPTTPVSKPTGKSKIIGDVSGDGEVTSEDSLIVLRISVGLDKAAGSTKLYDVNADGSIDSEDSLQILRYSVGLSASDLIGTKIS